MITKIRFKKRLMPTAYKIQESLGIFPTLIVTQAAHESNWGESELTRMACNLFGMTSNDSWIMSGKPILEIQTREYSHNPPEKIHYWNRSGDILEKRTDGKGGSILKVKVPFRKYGNWDESLWDWAGKISGTERYKKAYEAAKTGLPDTFFFELQNAGYATDPSYAKKLSDLYDFVEKLPNEEEDNDARNS